MSRLAKVREECQRVAEAIACALGVEVEIIDLDLVRIAGTGRVGNNVGTRLPRGFVNKYVLEHKEPIFISEAGKHAICSLCPLAGKCYYLASIVYPILAGEEILGNISLIAFDGGQKINLCQRTDSLMEFVGRLADLIGAKVLEMESVAEKIIMANQLHAVMDAAEESIIAVNESGQVTHFNLSAERMFNTLKEEIINQPLTSHISGLPVDEVLSAGTGFLAREMFVNVRGHRRMHLLVTIKPIIDSFRQPVGVVVSARDFKETQKLAYELVSAQKVFTFDDIIGVSPVLVELKKRSVKVAGSNSTILITGESGTGKEIVARAIHAASPRHNKPFVAINCGAIPESLLESELFGYEEGSFTGARKGGKPGKFELANQGTIFLDEIGNMSLYLQAKILRVLQERQIERVGGSQLMPVDIRIIAATNSDLEEMLVKGRFRDDLYYRLSVIPISIPPLRRRPEDIPLLLEHYRKYFSDLLGKSFSGYTRDALQLCLAYSWPGNVRELINAAEYAVNLEESDVIEVLSLPSSIREQGKKPCTLAKNHLSTLAQLEKEAIVNALNQFGWSEEGKLTAARSLGISRATIYRKIAKYRLNHRT